MGPLGLHRFLKKLGKALAYHLRGSRAAFEVGRARKSWTTFEGFAIAIFFRFVDCFALRANYDDRLGWITVARHLQEAVITVMPARQLDVEEIAIGVRANRLRYNNHILSKAGHPFFLLCESQGLDHIVTNL